MIPSLHEIFYGVFGAWRLFRLDPKAMAYFDNSVEGFWKSFFAAGTASGRRRPPPPGQIQEHLLFLLIFPRYVRKPAGRFYARKTYNSCRF